MSAGDIRAGKAYVEAFTKDNTAPGLRSMQNRFSAFAAQIHKIGGLAFSFKNAATMGMDIAQTVFQASGIEQAVKKGSDVKDAADRTGLTYQAVQELGYAAGQTATSVEALETGIKSMQRNVDGGSKGFVETLDRLGLTLDDLRGKRPDEQFTILAQALSQISDPTQRTAMAMKVFGKGGQELIPMLALGRDGIEELRKRAQELGIVMKDEAVEAAENLGDRMEDLKLRWEAMQQQLGTALIPAAEAAINVLEGVIVVLQRLGALEVESPEERAEKFGEMFGATAGGVGAPVGRPPIKGTKGDDVWDKWLKTLLKPATDAAGQVTGAFNGFSMSDFLAQPLVQAKLAELRAQAEQPLPDFARRAQEVSYVSPSNMLGTFDAKSAAGLFVGDIQKEQLAELKNHSGKLEEIAKNTADNGGLAIT